MALFTSDSTIFVEFSVILALFNVVSGQLPDSFIVLQNQYGECRSIWNPDTKIAQDRNTYQVISHPKERNFYEPDKDCVITVIGKVGWQWSITVSKFDIEKEGNRCPDALFLYDAERCDNAKLLKGIDFRTGLCGTVSESVLGQMTFTTCANKLTIQFKTDIRQTFNRGFAFEMTQYPWTNPTGGPDCDPSLNGIALGVWKDGTFNEFQNTWNEQPIIPGYVPSGDDTNYDKELHGIQCYDCQNCPVEPFDPEKDGTAKRSNCYTCSKEWDEEYQSARRRCMTRTSYLNAILAIKEIDTPFLGCRKTVNDFGRTVNYCFCETNLCNEAVIVKFSYTILLVTFMLLTVQRNILW